MFKSLCFMALLLVLSGCSGSHESLVRKAEEEALNQKSQLSKYLFLQVIKKHQYKDEIRFRALRGLARVSMTQLYDYPTASQAYELLFQEFSQVPMYREEMDSLRVQAARMYRKNLQDSEKALDVLSPLLSRESFQLDWAKELGLVYLALRNFEQAEHWLRQSWELAYQQKSCEALEDIQLQMIQVFSLRDQCDQVLTWTEQSFPSPCRPDEFAVAVERAHCFEIQGEVPKAMQLYEELIQENPQNMRAHFFLESLRKRQREKQQK